MTLMGTIVNLALAGSLLAGAPATVTVTAPGHTPKVNTHWSYTVHATSGGKPVAGRLTGQIVDPIGGTHPVLLGKSTTKITNRPFDGEFSDFIIWPPSSRGIPLELRVTVVVGKTKHVVTYAVTPRG